MKKLIIGLLVSASIVTPLNAQPRYSGGNEPVTLSATGTDPCSLAVIVDLGPEGQTPVYPGYSTELEIQDYVAGGQPVWVCEMDESGEMLGIVYSNFADHENCGVSTPVEEDTEYYTIGECESGWVEAWAVELLAG